jgi:hypothetical protein
MPVHKFRSVYEMPPLERVDGPDLIDRIRTLWNRAFALSAPAFPRGVTRFASIEDANRARFELLLGRMRDASSTARPDAEDGGGAGGTPASSEHLVDSGNASHGGPDGGTSSAG